MGRDFTVEYEDFTGGYFVGDNDIKQPFNTWTGDNICTTADEGFLMPDGGWTQSNQIYSGASPNIVTPIRWPVYPYPWYVVLAGSLYTVNSAGAVTAAGALSAAPTNYSQPCIANIAGTVTYVAAKGGPSTLIAAPGGSFVTAASTFFGTGAWYWKNWVLSFAGKTLYWTDPDALTTATGNYLAIPSNGDITGLVPTSDALLVMTGDGWWAVTGVLGETTSVRRITKFGGYKSFTASTRAGRVAAEVVGGIAHAVADGSTLRVLNGSLVSTFANLGTPDSETQVVQVGDGILVTNAVGSVYIWSDVRRTWRKSTPPVPATKFRLFPAEDPSAASSDIGCLGIYTSGGNYIAHMYTQSHDPEQPTLTSGAFDSATVELADYMRSKEFRVKEMLVEIDKGSTSGAGSATRSLAARLVTYPIVEVAGGGLDDASTGSTAVTRYLTSNDSTAGDREMLRFRINDAGPTFTAKPVLTLTGVKVRRVILRCEDV